MSRIIQGWLVLVILLVNIQLAYAQQPQNSVPDTSNLSKDYSSVREKLTHFIDPYGSYRINFGMTNEGVVGMADNASRVGLFGILPMGENTELKMFAQMELGVGLVDRDLIIVFRSDPGYEKGEADNAFFSRLGLIGVEDNHFSFSIGKQWSAYYDVASFTDLFYAFGGEASGAYNLGSDGGISGTGRANRLFLGRTNWGNWKLALQAQARSISENDVDFADTWGGSIRYLPEKGFQAGFAFNIVRDGVENPSIFQPKKGDQAWIGSLAFVKGKYHISLLGGRYIQHEDIYVNDTTSVFFNSVGIELFTSYSIDDEDKWRLASGFNYLQPDGSGDASKYRLLYFLGQVSYNFAYASNVFAIVKLNFGTNQNGDDIRNQIYGVGFRFSFGY